LARSSSTKLAQNFSAYSETTVRWYLSTCPAPAPRCVIFEINTDWPLIAWPYTAIAVVLTLFAFHIAGGWPWVRHFAFPIAFILVALVWPYRIEKL
jgi:hypothetical protein